MKFKGHMELEHGLRQIDIAPLIDVIFQLLIFFMLTSSFVIQPGIKIRLPKAVTSEVVSYENIEVVVSGESVVYIKGKVVTTDELRKLFEQAAKRNQTILIKADKRSPLGRVVEIWDMAREFNISQINIATDQD